MVFRQTRRVAAAASEHLPAGWGGRAGGRNQPGAAYVQGAMMMNMLRAGTGARSILIAAVCAAALSACGSVHANSGTAASAHPAKVSLVIQVAGKPGAKPHRWTLRCDPVGGTHPNPAAACHALLHAKRPFAPLPDHVMCPMIVAGSKTATISGTWFGKHVDSHFNQRGCGNLRWAKIGQVFN